eukprot:CAMPEP_0119111852 /NCGR_PEP_ID=MMETSP1180-20130426/37603_1 /TAXON_ID=3052 ORGANISM="Chlamydomonas cf sp, Strain CCMP681" /NCGR_SAMPLE_ID=MMETSP1180 /ASSEMBLY_ACC=CAM_ASM_000741 /LENGTH=42 /DNA_ID= /DNA_START= /DNA_END= /DNA_ORIENTATION=
MSSGDGGFWMTGRAKAAQGMTSVASSDNRSHWHCSPAAFTNN